MQNIYLHAQLSKAGGGTVIPMLSRNMPGFLDSCILPSKDKFFSSNDIRRMLDMSPGRQWISSHLFSLDMPFDYPHGHVRALVFVREPAELVSSIYQFCRGSFDVEFPETREYSFEDFIEKFVVRRERSRGNSLASEYFADQAQYLVGPNESDPIARMTALVKEKRLLIFPVDRIGDAFVCLERAFPSDFKDTSYAWKGNSTRAKKENLSNSLREKIQNHTILDCQMYKMACQHMDDFKNSLFKKDGDFQNAMDNFIRRRKQRQHAAQIHDFFRNAVDQYLDFRGYVGKSVNPIFRYHWPNNGKNGIAQQVWRWGQSESGD